MANYQSVHTGPQIDAGIDKANSAVQPGDLGDLASKDTVNYETEVTNKPTIPAEVTEQTVAGWGFTKNTGDYTKPVDGIPATDLTQAVQTILEKANATNLSTYEFNETDLGPTILAYIATNNPDLLKVTTQQGAVQDYYKGQDREYYCYINGYFIVLTITGSEGSYNLDTKSYRFDDFSEVSGTNDGTNWTSITIDGTTKSIPAGGAPQLIATKIVDDNDDPYNPIFNFPSITELQPGHYYMVTKTDWTEGMVSGVVEFIVFDRVQGGGESDQHFATGTVVYWQDGTTPSPTGTVYDNYADCIFEISQDDNVWSLWITAGMNTFNDGAEIRLYYKPL